MSNGTTFSTIITNNRDDVLDAWVSAQAQTRTARLMPRDELVSQCASILDSLSSLKSYDASAPEAARAKDLLTGVSRRRGLQGFTPEEIAKFIFSLKDAIAPLIREELKGSPEQLAQEMADLNTFIDQLGLSTFSAYVESREEYIKEQQRAILELSTPVVEVWEGILALPVVGSVDTARTQQMMESLLTRIVDTGSSVIIIDITGVPVVDTAVAKHLLQTVSAAKLLGAECILVGISARIAQTLVHLGVDLSGVITTTTLARGLDLALTMTGRTVVKAERG